MTEDLSAPGEIHALLGRGTAYTGKLTFEGRVRIDGTFDGEIFSAGTLIIGDSADVKGSIDVGTLIVLGGHIQGQVHARELVELHAPGRVTGDIVTPQLFIDRGVVFEGQCTMGDEAGSPPETHSLGAEEKLLSDLETAATISEADSTPPPADEEVLEAVGAPPAATVTSGDSDSDAEADSDSDAGADSDADDDSEKE
ncbi:MAG: polymer-forming cytoskeletal protein [Deltaproteobacteria bacterium]|nr:polymer-forming cytoskeletal protein [Deltaproteobacteria bacterium]